MWLQLYVEMSHGNGVGQGKEFLAGGGLYIRFQNHAQVFCCPFNPCPSYQRVFNEVRLVLKRSNQ
jgi:hypothetical protein